MGHKGGWLLRVRLLDSAARKIFSYYLNILMQFFKSKERYYDVLYIKVKHMELHLNQLWKQS